MLTQLEFGHKHTDFVFNISLSNHLFINFVKFIFFALFLFFKNPKVDFNFKGLIKSDPSGYDKPLQLIFDDFNS